MSLLDSNKTYELTVGDVYNIDLCSSVSSGAYLENLLYNALNELDIIKYPSDFEKLVKSLLNVHLEPLDINMNISIQHEQHPIWPEQKVIKIFMDNDATFTYYLTPKLHEHT